MYGNSMDDPMGFAYGFEGELLDVYNDEQMKGSFIVWTYSTEVWCGLCKSPVGAWDGMVVQKSSNISRVMEVL